MNKNRFKPHVSNLPAVMCVGFKRIAGLIDAGCGWLSAATITFSPRAPHALIFVFFLLLAARQAERQLRGSRTPHCSVHLGCLLLHGYKLSRLAIGSHSTELTVHWLNEEKNIAAIGGREVAGGCDWLGSVSPAPWRLGPV